MHRNRARYWMLAIVLLMLGNGFFVLLDYPYCAVGTVLHMLGTSAAIAALLGHRLPDLAGVVPQGQLSLQAKVQVSPRLVETQQSFSCGPSKLLEQ